MSFSPQLKDTDLDFFFIEVEKLPIRKYEYL